MFLFTLRRKHAAKGLFNVQVVWKAVVGLGRKKSFSFPPSWPMHLFRSFFTSQLIAFCHLFKLLWKRELIIIIFCSWSVEQKAVWINLFTTHTEHAVSRRELRSGSVAWENMGPRSLTGQVSRLFYNILACQHFALRWGTITVNSLVTDHPWCTT